MKALLKWTGILIFTGLLVGLPIYTYGTARELTSNWQITELGDGGLLPSFIFNPATETPQPAAESEGTTPVPGQDPTAVPVDITDDFDVWNGSERVTVLVMGLDHRDWEAGDDAPRTDTMMLLTLDPLSNTAGMLSIPRDLYVPIPGFDYGRINTAYRLGEIYALPGGGPALAVATVEQLLGIPIDFYAQVDFTTFERMIDEIGGLKIDVQEPIEVDPIGPGLHKFLEPGRQTLPGPVALAYARARNTEGGDFDRAQRQQQVVLAIRDRVLSFDLIPILLSKSGALYNELSEGVDTDMTLEQAIALGLLAADIPIENIQRGVIAQAQTVAFTTFDGDQVLKPIPDQIRVVRDQVFGTVDLTSPLADTPLEEKAQAENATIMVMNATQIDGVGNLTIDFLNTVGLQLSGESVGSADQAQAYTSIIDYTGNPYTIQLLVEIFDFGPNQIRFEYNPASTVDVAIFMGTDYKHYIETP
jgi:LCP family protein required for cell wall assembly